jgi:uncharacterized protein (DUF1501 family)
MDKSYLTTLSRRHFIRQAACAALGTGALGAAIRDLRFMNAAVAQTNIGPTDYKALVCIFLAGGNDSNNLIVPTINSEYNSYASIRTPVLALPQSSLLNISSMNSDGHTYGLHPVCQGTGGNSTLGLKPLFDAGRLAILFNAGTLAYPLTKTQYNASPSKRPPQLFSHADQVTQWQTSVPDQPPVNGWGGRTADLLNSVQTNAPVSLSITLAGANTFEVGNEVSQYSVSTSGAIAFQGVSGTRQTALTNILKQVYPNMQAKAYSDVAFHSLNTGTLLNNAIAATANTNNNTVQFWTIPFPGSGTNAAAKLTNPLSGSVFNSSLGPQLSMIARLIEAGSRTVAQGGFGMLRQIFFCQVGGYDLHTGQTDVPVGGSVLNGAHSNLLYELSHCMAVFQAAIDQIGGMATHNDPNFAKRVTSFTASDFGRTFPGNGLGSDHGWGSHHVIMGGAVNGQQTYGKFPTLTVGGPDDTSTGRWIPTTACDQYFSTLATWFGVDTSNLSSVFPNLGRFPIPNLGFMG